MLSVIRTMLIIFLTADCSVCVVAGVEYSSSVMGVSGSSVRLPCSVNEEKCGQVHNIQWFKRDTRVHIYSPVPTLNLSENMLQDRAVLHYANASAFCYLEITKVRPSDGDLYKCEPTYQLLEPDCDQIHYINFTSLAIPGAPEIFLANRTSSLAADETIGPFVEGTQVQLTCQSSGAKPAASLLWTNKYQHQLAGESEAVYSADGTAVSRSRLSLLLTRALLNDKLTCSASNQASSHALNVSVVFDVHVPASSVTVGDLDQPVIEGHEVTIKCHVTGARPAANIRWYMVDPRDGNSSVPIKQNIAEISTEVTDGTSETVSRITLNVTRNLHSSTLVCAASNSASTTMKLAPLFSSITLDIWFAPVVSVFPEYLTVRKGENVTIKCIFTANPPQLTNIVWYHNDEVLYTETLSHEYSLTNTSLVLSNVSADSGGEYRCRVFNTVGDSLSINHALLDIHYVPTVRLSIEPSSVIEMDELNVTFSCHVLDARPRRVLHVRWLLGGQLLKQLEVKCNVPSSTTPTDSQGSRGQPSSMTPVIDPLMTGRDDDDDEYDDVCGSVGSQLLLLHVDRAFAANYSCQAANSAGWGPPSASTTLNIYYPPGMTSITHQPQYIIKGSPVSLLCQLDDPGYPPASKFVWMRGNRVMTEVTTRQWFIEEASLYHHAVVACTAMNRAGRGPLTKKQLTVNASPRILSGLRSSTLLVVNNAREHLVHLHCTVECCPVCQVHWTLNNQTINSTWPLFSFNQSVLTADYRAGLFDSVRSNLFIKTSWLNWSDVTALTGHVTCVSSSTAAGPAVNSSTQLIIHYPPVNVTISGSQHVRVLEGDVTAAVTCSASSQPAAKYSWIGPDGEEVQSGATLQLAMDEARGVVREQAGVYTCLAYNQYGRSEIRLLLTVLYPPSCRVRLARGDWLVCEVDATPHTHVQLNWLRDGRPLSETVVNYTTSSAVQMAAQSPGKGLVVYECVANSSLGRGPPCRLSLSDSVEMDVTVSEAHVLIFASAALSVGLILALVCVAVMLVCRRNDPHSAGPASAKLSLASINLLSRDNPPAKSSTRTSQVGGELAVTSLCSDRVSIAPPQPRDLGHCSPHSAQLGRGWAVRQTTDTVRQTTDTLFSYTPTLTNTVLLKHLAHTDGEVAI